MQRGAFVPRHRPLKAERLPSLRPRDPAVLGKVSSPFPVMEVVPRTQVSFGRVHPAERKARCKALLSWVSADPPPPPPPQPHTPTAQ